MNLVELFLYRPFDTPIVRGAFRTFAMGLLFLVFMGAVVQAAEEGHEAGHAVPADHAAADEAGHDEEHAPAASSPGPAESLPGSGVHESMEADHAPSHDEDADGHNGEPAKRPAREQHGPGAGEAPDAAAGDGDEGSAPAHQMTPKAPTNAAAGHGEGGDAHGGHETSAAHPDAVDHGEPTVGGPDGTGHRGPVSQLTREERLRYRIEFFTKQGVEAWLRGDREGAEDAFARALNVNLPVEYKRDLIMKMADLYEQDEQLGKAIATLEKLNEVDPKNPDRPAILLKLGILYRKTGAYDLARKRMFQVLNSTLSVDPERFEENRWLSMKARFEIAETYAKEGRFEEARRYFSRLQRLDLSPEDLERVKYREAQLHYQLKQWREAADRLGEFIKEYPESSYAGEARYMRAKALEALELRDEAMQEVVALLAAAPGEPARAAELAHWQRRAANELANRFYEQGDFVGALTIYQALARASAAPSWRWPALYQIGLCFERLNLPQRAAEAYHLIVNPEPLESEKAEEPSQEEPAEAAGGAHGAGGPAVKAAPEPEPLDESLKALQQMAQWRLDHLEWIEDFENRLHVLTAKPDA